MQSCIDKAKSEICDLYKKEKYEDQLGPFLSNIYDIKAQRDDYHISNKALMTQT